MSFLSIAFLTALPLALTPLLLHLFDRRRNVVIEWGAMQFLQEAVTRRTSARKLKQWLLLLLRTLALLALILALSRPFIPGNWFSGTDRGETILVIDNSMSMQRKVDETTLFKNAIAQAKEQLDDLPSTDFVRVLLSSPYPSWATTGSLRADTNSLQIVIDQLDELQTTNGSSDLLSALFTAVQAEVQPTQQSRQIILLTDRQANDWDLDEEESWQRFQTTLTGAEVPTDLKVINLAKTSKSLRNVAVNSITANRTTVGVDRPLRLSAEIQNLGNARTSSANATWKVDEKESNTSQIPELDTQSTHQIEWQHSFSAPGVYAVTCQLDVEDDLREDNESTLVVEVIEEVPILLVEGSPTQTELQRDAFFVETALGWIDGEKTFKNTVYTPTVVTPERLEHIDLAEFQAVVIPNLTELSAKTVGRLEEFVTAGGGCWIGVGPRSDVDAFNQRFFADGHGLAPLRLDRIIDSAQNDSEESDETDTRTKINPFMKGHPATASLSDSDQLDLADVTVSRRFRFEVTQSDEETSVLLSLTNGEPLAVENYFGRGRVIVQGVPLRMQWSKLARSQSFVVMIHDWLDYLTQPLATRHNLSPGDELAIRLKSDDVQLATLKTPYGNEIELTAEPTDGGTLFRSNRTILPGEYRLNVGTTEEIPFNVSRDTAESDLTALSREQVSTLDELTTAVASSKKNESVKMSGSEPLWSYLLLGLILLIAAELLLAGMISRERFGAAPIAETNQTYGDDPLPLFQSNQPANMNSDTSVETNKYDHSVVSIN